MKVFVNYQNVADLSLYRYLHSAALGVGATKMAAPV